jgi:hypothetical protein
VAESYQREGLGDENDGLKRADGSFLYENKMTDAEAIAWGMVDQTKERTLDAAIGLTEKLLSNAAETNAGWKPTRERSLSILKKWKAEGAEATFEPGNVYTVEAKADPASFLDWDEPIGEQSAAVLKALFPGGLGDGVNKTTPTGQFYTSLISARGGQGAAKELMKAGIPGVRYLDEGSRANASYLHMISTSRANWVKLRDHQPPEMVKRFGKMDMGAWHKHVDAQIAFWDKELAGRSDEQKRVTRNYVVFDPKTLRVTHRNGVPLDGGASDTILAGDDFNPSEPRKNDGEWTDGGAGGGKSPIISTRNVTAKRAQAGKASYLRVDTQAMKADPALYKHNVDLFKLARFYPGMRPDEVKGSTDEIASHVINRMRENLDYIVGLVPHAKVKEWAHWYDGARKYAHDFATKYKIDDASAAAVIAALSPQKPWDENVYFADRVMDIATNHAHAGWDTKAKELAARTPTVAKMVKSVEGKRLDELENPAAKALWIRTYNEAHEDRTFHIARPDGTLGPIMTTATGAPDHASWGSLAQIANALIVMDSGGSTVTRTPSIIVTPSAVVSSTICPLISSAYP